MFFYEFKNNVFASINKIDYMTQISETKASQNKDNIYFLGSMNPKKSKRSFCLSHTSYISLEEETPEVLNFSKENLEKLPIWFIERLKAREITYINKNYPNWQNVLNISLPEKWRINVIGLGDVGGTLAVGLKLLGSDCIDEIGIFDLDENKRTRWKYELGQILCSSTNDVKPVIKELREDELFNCDMFVFCVSVGVPPISETKKDVRMLQFEGNSKVVNHYARLARKNKFNGIFAVVSDPVELLCKSAFIASNTDNDGKMDFLGLAPEQIRGYGLGVMHARAVYYSMEKECAFSYSAEGRAFGQHGEGLIIANSILSFDEELSSYLTTKTKLANIEVRKSGFKPYIAPALSSGALSLIDTIKGNWHYSSNYIGGVYFGARNRLLKSGVEIESLELPEGLMDTIRKEYSKMEEII